MPKVSGAFDFFKDLDTIPVEDVIRWVKHPPDPLILYNFLANKILYPQAIGTTQDEIEWELALLREALRRNPIFLNIKTKKIIIPEIFVSRVPNLAQLALAFVDAYILGWTTKNPGENIWTLILKNSDKEEVIGSVLMPEFIAETGNITISILKKSIQSAKGGVLILPCEVNSCVVDFKVNGGKLLGTDQGSVSVLGGKLGILVDARS